MEIPEEIKEQLMRVMQHKQGIEISVAANFAEHDAAMMRRDPQAAEACRERGHALMDHLFDDAATLHSIRHRMIQLSHDNDKHD
jgi:hypothetical protein